MTERDNICLQFAMALQNCFLEEDKKDTTEFSPIELKDGADITGIVFEMIRALYIVYQQITGDETTDILGFTYLINRIVVGETDMIKGEEAESDVPTDI